MKDDPYSSSTFVLFYVDFYYFLFIEIKNLTNCVEKKYDFVMFFGGDTMTQIFLCGKIIILSFDGIQKKQKVIESIGKE